MAKILIVEDEDVIVRMLKRRLEKRGHELHIAENGQIGIEMVLEIQPDLVLMDILMPIMDGSQATQILREKGYQGLIVVLSASATAHQGPKALEAGCDYFLTKPIDSDFEEQIETMIENFKKGQ